MVSRNNCVEVELDAENCDVLFKPLGRELRGRVDFSTIDRDGAGQRHKDWGKKPVPGQVVGVNLKDGTGYVREPVHSDAKMKAKAEKHFALAPEVETFEKIDTQRWLRAIGRLLQSGFARLVKGDPPAVKPRAARPTATELLAAATYATLTPEQKELADAKLADLRR